MMKKSQKETSTTYADPATPPVLQPPPTATSSAAHVGLARGILLITTEPAPPLAAQRLTPPTVAQPAGVATVPVPGQLQVFETVLTEPGWKTPEFRAAVTSVRPCGRKIGRTRRREDTN